MRCQTLDSDDRFRKTVVVIIILAWLIVTIRSGYGWLSPIDITFFGLLLGRPTTEAVQ